MKKRMPRLEQLCSVSVVALVCLALCQGAACMMNGEQKDWCSQENEKCRVTCAGFWSTLDRVSFDCNNRTSLDRSTVVEAATCVCLGANDVILSSSSSSNSRNVGGGGQSSSNSFASASGS